MERGQPILELRDAVPRKISDAAIHVPLGLKLERSEFALIQCQYPGWIEQFADICCGLRPLQRGAARFLGREWAELPDALAAALRGRIGRVFRDGGWIGFLDMETNILLSQRHHTRRGLSELRQKAMTLAYDFGLPGFPVGSASGLHPADLARAACIRAFLGEPLMVVLEAPLRAEYGDLAAPLINAISSARNRGAAVIWLTPDDATWRDRSVPTTHRLRLSEEGLTPSHRFS